MASRHRDPLPAKYRTLAVAHDSKGQGANHIQQAKTYAHTKSLPHATGAVANAGPGQKRVYTQF